MSYLSPTASYHPNLLVLQRPIISITPTDYDGISREELFFPAQSQCLSAANLVANHSTDMETAKAQKLLIAHDHSTQTQKKVGEMNSCSRHVWTQILYLYISVRVDIDALWLWCENHYIGPSVCCTREKDSKTSAYEISPASSIDNIVYIIY